MPLDLLVPDLLSTPADPFLNRLRMPALERWLGRANTARRPEAGANALLASAFGLPVPPPVAAFSLVADTGPREGSWLRADPVHLRIDRDALVLHDPSMLEIARDEALALVAELQSLFGADGLEFHAATAERWYVRVPEGETPRTTPLEDAVGRNVSGMLPRGSGRINWPSAITEAQMLLSAHEVNRLREAADRPAINSVWFWGEGARPQHVASPYALVCANDPFARGLALASGTRLAARPAGAAAVDAVREGEAVLVVLDELGPPLRRGDAAAWASAAARLDDDWFVELRGAIERFEAVRLILPKGRDTLVANVTAGSRWRWFRRRKPLAAHA